MTDAGFVPPFRFEDQERHAIAMREAAETLSYETEEGQRLSFLHLNRDFKERAPLIGINAMFAGTNWPEQMYTGYQRAAAHPNRSVVILDLPAHGLSDRLTNEQFKAIETDHNLSPVAKALLEVFPRRLPDANSAIITGESVGARVAFDMVRKAGEVGVKPLVMIGFEPCGLEQRTSIGVNYSFFWREPRMHNRLYRQGGPQQVRNQIYEDAFQAFKAELALAGVHSKPAVQMYIDVFRREPRLLRFLIANSPLAASSGIKSFENMLEAVPDMSTRIVVGGLSKICRWNKIAPWAHNLALNYKERLAFDVWPEDSHGMSLAPQQPRLSAYTANQVAEHLG